MSIILEMIKLEKLNKKNCKIMYDDVFNKEKYYLEELNVKNIRVNKLSEFWSYDKKFEENVKNGSYDLEDDWVWRLVY